MTTNNGCKVLLSLADLESSAEDPTEIDYFVPGQNNKPEPCTISIVIGGGIEVPEGSIHVGGEKYQISGMQNFCRDPKKDDQPSGCDPYNCHQRIPSME